MTRSQIVTISAATLVLVALFPGAAAATDYPLTWTFGSSYPDMNIAPDDTVTWTYSPSHNVWEFPDETAFDNCDFNLAIMVGASNESPLTVIFSEEGTRYFGCAVGSHCSSGGMKVMITTEQTGLIFASDFESGDLEGWTTHVP